VKKKSRGRGGKGLVADAESGMFLGGEEFVFLGGVKSDKGAKGMEGFWTQHPHWVDFGAKNRVVGGGPIKEGRVKQKDKQ